MNTPNPILRTLDSDFAEQFGLPPITPPVVLSDAEMAEGDLTEVRR